jgi:hypothetical protein
MFDKLEALMPLFEKKFKLKKQSLTTADEFKAALLKLSAGAGADRLFVEGEFKGREVVAILVLK